jgi:hypothetical protein
MDGRLAMEIRFIAAAVDIDFLHSHYFENYLRIIFSSPFEDATSIFLTFPPLIGGAVRQTCAAEFFESDHFNL